MAAFLALWYTSIYIYLRYFFYYFSSSLLLLFLNSLAPSLTQTFTQGLIWSLARTQIQTRCFRIRYFQGANLTRFVMFCWNSTWTTRHLDYRPREICKTAIMFWKRKYLSKGFKTSRKSEKNLQKVLIAASVEGDIAKAYIVLFSFTPLLIVACERALFLGKGWKNVKLSLLYLVL